MDKIFEVKSTTGQIMNVYEDRVELTQEGVLGFLTQGLQGTKTYFFKDITTIQFKNCGWTSGFFEFTFPGGHDGRGGSLTGITNDNRFIFGAPTIGRAKEIAKEMEKVNEYLQKQLSESKKEHSQNVNGISVADEILKLKNLMDEGIISEDEFQVKKKQLLNI